MAEVVGVSHLVAAEVKGVKFGDLITVQLEVEHVQVLRQTPRVRTLRNRNQFVFDVPAQDDLRRAPAVSLCDAGHDRRREKRAFLAT